CHRPPTCAACRRCRAGACRGMGGVWSLVSSRKKIVGYDVGMDNQQLEAAGREIALSVLVAHALAISVRGHDDPRGALRTVLFALEETVAEAVSKIEAQIPPDSREVLSNAARTTVLDAARTADSLLIAMGAPPAT